MWWISIIIFANKNECKSTRFPSRSSGVVQSSIKWKLPVRVKWPQYSTASAAQSHTVTFLHCWRALVTDLRYVFSYRRWQAWKRSEGGCTVPHRQGPGVSSRPYRINTSTIGTMRSNESLSSRSGALWEPHTSALLLKSPSSSQHLH